MEDADDHESEIKLKGSVIETKSILRRGLRRHLRPVSNVVLLPCRNQLIELNSTLAWQQRNTASLAVLHGSSSTWFQTSCYRRAELNS